jgi:hypothetical protein
VSDSRPASLVIVAWLFIAAGAVTLLKMGYLRYEGYWSVDFLFLLLPLGIGLLKRIEWCRQAALVVVATLIACQTIVLGFILATHRTHYDSVAGFAMAGSTASPVFIGAQAVSFGLLLWLCRALTRTDVRAAFQRKAVSS